jgi:hypothetical protein
MKRFAAILLLGGSMLLPATFAKDHRYYDRDSKDWHVWNNNEDRAYRHWLTEERHEQRYRAYNRLKHEQQAEYWRWRHAHSDWR